MNLLHDNCFCQCKDTNSKAIHNHGRAVSVSWNIVFANAKILIRKQFTTVVTNEKQDIILFLPMQRY